MRATPFITLSSLLLGGCAYQADSFSYSSESFRGVYVTVECLDLAIERRPDVRHGSDVIAYQFGNRCDEPTVVDLASVRVYGRAADGAQIELVAYDPNREIRPSRIDGRAVGREAIAYTSTVAVRDICVDAASIAHTAPPRWLCFNGE